MGQQILFGQPAHAAIMRGVDVLANAVKITLGVKGRNVIIGSANGVPHSTKDGVTVARFVDPEDATDKIGATIVREAAAKTAEMAGDGTTTATVLTQAILKLGFEAVAKGTNPLHIKKGIDEAVKIAVAKIKEMARPVENNSDLIMQIASVSANNDEEIGGLIRDAFKQIGMDGIMYIEEANGVHTEIKVVEGMEVSAGFMNHQFMNRPEKGRVDFDNPFIMVTDKKIESVDPLLKIIAAIVGTGRPLVIFCSEVNPDALRMFVHNSLKGTLPCCIVKVPEFGDFIKEAMLDICVRTGATLISDDKNDKFEKVDLTWLGSARNITVTSDKTTIIEGKCYAEDLEERKEIIAGQIEEQTDDRLLAKLKYRLAKLSGKVAVLSVGASTVLEMKEKKDRVDDAIRATRAAIEEGVVPGGGTTYIRCAKMIDAYWGDGMTVGETTGMTIMAEALRVPVKQMCINSGYAAADIDNVPSQIYANEMDDHGWDGNTETFENMMTVGIIDPAKVARVALENAASIAGTLLTTDCVLV
jgi:chaperonin GroEL